MARFTLSSYGRSRRAMPLESSLLLRQFVTSSTATSLSLALQHYINSDFPVEGQKVHAHIIKVGFVPNTNVYIKLLILHLKSCYLSYARKVFDLMHNPTLSAYNYMISGYIKHDQFQNFLCLVRRLVLSNERPDAFTFSMILKGSTAGGSVFLLSPRGIGGQVHAQILKSNIDFDDILSTALVDSYVKSGNVSYARRVFDIMLDKNVFCSTSMISGYMSEGSVDKAEEIFERSIEKDVVVFNAMIEGYSKTVGSAKKSFDVYIDMLRLNFQPTVSTFASLIGACALVAAYEIGQQFHCHLMKTVFFGHIKIGSALVDMYSKCGRVEDACIIFDRMHEKNVFTWTSMIDGYGRNGYSYEALELFDRMECISRIKPNYITFLSALSACGHAGLVAKGEEIFESIEKKYLMRPKMEHYACMVDMLGRAGCLDEAWKLVMEMNEKPNADVWAALLSSCWLHNDVEMACRAANEILRLNINDRPGAFVALSNTFAAAGKWGNVIKLRDLMKEKGFSKNMGYSFLDRGF